MGCTMGCTMTYILSLRQLIEGSPFFGEEPVKIWPSVTRHAPKTSHEGKVQACKIQHQTAGVMYFKLAEMFEPTISTFFSKENNVGGKQNHVQILINTYNYS